MKYSMPWWLWHEFWHYSHPRPPGHIALQFDKTQLKLTLCSLRSQKPLKQREDIEVKGGGGEGRVSAPFLIAWEGSTHWQILPKSSPWASNPFPLSSQWRYSSHRKTTLPLSVKESANEKVFFPAPWKTDRPFSWLIFLTHTVCHKCHSEQNVRQEPDLFSGLDILPL